MGFIGLKSLLEVFGPSPFLLSDLRCGQVMISLIFYSALLIPRDPHVVGAILEKIPNELVISGEVLVESLTPLERVRPVRCKGN